MKKLDAKNTKTNHHIIHNIDETVTHRTITENNIIVDIIVTNDVAKKVIIRDYCSMVDEVEVEAKNGEELKMFLETKSIIVLINKLIIKDGQWRLKGKIILK